MRLKHRCKMCKRDMSIETSIFPIEFRTMIVLSATKGNGRWCIDCRKKYKLGEYKQ